MNTLQTIVLSTVQGITELLPISSSGHLILVSDLLGLKEISNFTLTTFHLGTTLAILLFNWKFLTQSLLSKAKLKLLGNIVLASIPAAIIGFAYGDLIEQALHDTWIVALSLIVVGVVFILVENLIEEGKTKSMEDLTFKQTIIAGIGQTLALIPGVSRSGITTISSMLSGVEKYTALSFSFILGLPVLGGSFLYKMVSEPNSLVKISSFNSILGIVITFIVGYLSLYFLKSMAKTKFLTYFGIYRIVVGGIILISLTI